VERELRLGVIRQMAVAVRHVPYWYKRWLFT